MKNEDLLNIETIQKSISLIKSFLNFEDILS
jgi:hypothetical protein